jgi:hypothetical protein
MSCLNTVNTAPPSSRVVLILYPTPMGSSLSGLSKSISRIAAIESSPTSRRYDFRVSPVFSVRCQNHSGFMQQKSAVRPYGAFAPLRRFRPDVASDRRSSPCSSQPADRHPHSAAIPQERPGSTSLLEPPTCARDMTDSVVIHRSIRLSGVFSCHLQYTKRFYYPAFRTAWLPRSCR